MAKKPSGQASRAKSPAPNEPTAAHRVVLLRGKDAFLRTFLSDTLRAALAEAHGGVDSFRFDGATTKPAEVLDECRTFGLMAGHKLVAVDNADQFVKEDARPLVERYVQQPSEGATLLLRADNWHAGKLDDMIRSVGAIIDCDPLPEAKAAAWAITRAAEAHDAVLPQDAAGELVDRIGPDLGRIDGELAKMALAAGRGGTITTKLVTETVGFTREEEVWNLQQTLLTGSSAQALEHIHQIVNVSRESPTLVTFAVADLARKIYGAAVGQRARENPRQLMTTYKMFGATGDAIFAAARQMTPASAAKILAACVDADMRGKTGLGDPARNAEILALRFVRLRQAALR